MPPAAAPPKNLIQLLVVATLCAFAPITPTAAQTSATYDLTWESGLWVGCLPPCVCPNTLLGPAAGAFHLDLISTQGDIETYDITNVNTNVAQMSGAVIDLTGSGTLTRNKISGELDMTIDAVVSGSPTVFHTVSYDPSVLFPELRLQLADSVTCSTTFFNVVAVPIQHAFLRGDCNQDTFIDLADSVRLLTYLFPIDVTGDGVPDLVEPGCFDSCDANDDGLINLSDAVRILTSLFGAQPDPLPGPGTCALDPTEDELHCLSPGC